MHNHMGVGNYAPQFYSGLTLIELLITLALVSTVLLIAIPSMKHIVVENRVNIQINQIVTGINFARSAAIQRGENIIFCGSSNLETCDGQWRAGQIVLAGNQILRIYPALPASDRLTWSSNLGKDATLEMLPTGFTKGQNGSFNYCPQDQRYAKRIVVSQTGRVRVTEDGINCQSI